MVATLHPIVTMPSDSGFQSAFHRGNGCYINESKQIESRLFNSFSPLFIAAMVATALETEKIGIV